MGANRKWYLVAYDIRDPQRLRRIAKHLEGYGQRIQYSLFRCRLNERQRERLQWELTKISRVEDDVIFIGVCDTCVGQIIKKGFGGNWELEPALYEII